MSKTKFREFPRNPLAEELCRRHEEAISQVLRRLGDDDTFSIDTPSGWTHDRGDCLTATDDEAAMAKIYISGHADVDLRGDYVQETLDWLHQMKRKCARAIRRLEGSRSAGTLDLRTIQGYIVEVDDEPVCGPVVGHVAKAVADRYGDDATIWPLYEDEAGDDEDQA